MSATTAGFIGRLFGGLITIVLGAFVVQFVTSRFAAFRPRYVTALSAAAAGWGAPLILGYFLAFATGVNLGGAEGIVTLLTCVIGFFVQAAFYTLMIKSPDGVALGFGKACMASLLQLVAAAIVIGGLTLMFLGAASLQR